MTLFLGPLWVAQAVDRGGGGGSLWMVWPVGVVMVIVPSVSAAGGPAWLFFGVVASFAEALTVVDLGGSAVSAGGDVVGVFDRGVAERGAAGLVAGDEELSG